MSDPHDEDCVCVACRARIREAVRRAQHVQYPRLGGRHMVGCRCQLCSRTERYRRHTLDRANGYASAQPPAPVTPIEPLPDVDPGRRAAWARFQYVAALCFIAFVAALATFAFIAVAFGW